MKTDSICIQLEFKKKKKEKYMKYKNEKTLIKCL